MSRPSSILAARALAAVCALVLVALSTGTFDARAQLPLGAVEDDPALHEDGKPTLAPLLREVTPAVVNISVTTSTRAARNPLLDDPFFRRFFDLPEQRRNPVPRRSAGSGVIVDAERGYVLTNHHVIENAGEVTVTLTDRRRFDAELIGSDAGTDIALLQIQAENLTALALGDSDALEVGDFVVAIGNPFGLGQTVTSGIVSALGRRGLNPEGYEDFIQTDASINPGNSGGALVDLDGTLVGINTAIVAPSGGNVGIGFAVPADMARQVVEQLVDYGEVRRGRLGVYIQDVTPELAEALGLDVPEGALITQVEPGSPAERAGLEPGDVVVELDGEAVLTGTDLRNEVGLMRAGSSVEMVYVRDGQRRRADVELTGAEARAGGAETIERLRGAEFTDLGANHPLYGQVQGVLVARVEAGSPAARNGLREGDIVLAVNRVRVRSVGELSRALETAAGSTIALNVLRDNARLFIVIQ